MAFSALICVSLGLPAIGSRALHRELQLGPGRAPSHHVHHKPKAARGQRMEGLSLQWGHGGGAKG